MSILCYYHNNKRNNTDRGEIGEWRQQARVDSLIMTPIIMPIRIKS